MKLYGLGGEITNQEIEQVAERGRFLIALVEELPEIAVEINQLFDKFESMCELLGKKKNHILSFDTEREMTEARSFIENVEEWAEPWFINEDWVIDSVLRMFRVWYENDDNKYMLVMSNPEIGNYRKIMKELYPNGTIELPVFNILKQNEKTYLDYAKKAVKEHIKSVKTLANRSGYNTAKQKRNMGHYKWFIKYHILGMSISELMEETGMEDRVILSHINRLYKVLGFDKRKS